MEQESMASNALRNFFGADRDDFTDTVHVAIDVQRQFCDPDYGSCAGTQKTQTIAQHIAGDIVPGFRDIGVLSAFVYLLEHYSSGRAHGYNPPDHYGGFFKLPPKADYQFPKVYNSAFKKGCIPNLFREFVEHNNVKNLIVSGFNACVCVKRTVEDAISENLNVCVLSDAVENSARCYDIRPNIRLADDLQSMADSGAVVASYDDVSRYICDFSVPSVS